MASMSFLCENDPHFSTTLQQTVSAASAMLPSPLVLALYAPGISSSASFLIPGLACSQDLVAAQ